MKSLSEVRPQMFAVKGEKGRDEANIRPSEPILNGIIKSGEKMTKHSK